MNLLGTEKEILQQKKSIYTWGMWASLVIGVLYLAIGILLPLDPAEKFRGEQFFLQLGQTPFIPLVWRLMFVVVAFASLFWITTAVTFVNEKNRKMAGLFQFAVLMGYSGAIVSGLDWIREIFVVREYMMVYAGKGELYTLISQLAGVCMDPDFVWKFGGVGAWYLVTCLLAKKNNIFSKSSNILGMLAGIDLIFTMVFAITDTIVYFGNGMQLALMQITALLGGIIGAIYHLKMFFELKKYINDMKA